MKKKNLVIIILAIIVILLSGIIYYQYKKLNNNCLQNESSTVEEKNEDNNPVENNTTEIDTIENNTVSIENKTFDLSKVEMFKNYDGTYGDVKSFEPYSEEQDYHRYVMLSFDGKVRVCINGTWNECNYIKNVSNVIDIVEMSYVGEEKKYYMLQSNGDVYAISTEDTDSQKYSATKVKDVSNVIKISNYNYCPREIGGCDWGIFVVTSDNQYIQIDYDSV